MFQGFIGREIQRTNRNLFFKSVSILGIPVAIGMLGWNSYWGDFFGGAKLVTSHDLIATPDEYMGRFVKIVGTGNTDLGLQEITHKTTLAVINSEEVSAKMIAIDLDETTDRHHAILVKLKNDVPVGNSVTGTIASIPYDISTEVKSVIDDNATLPVMLDGETDFRALGYIGLVVGGFSTLWGGAELYGWKRQQRDRTLHPIVKRLSRYGQAEIVAQSIEQELGMSNGAIDKKTKLTASWLIHRAQLELEIGKLADIVWVYFQVTSNRLHGVIPIGNTYTVICYDRDGGKLEIPGAKAQVMAIVEQLQMRLPWAIVGYTDEIELAWRSDRSNFIAMVDADRQKF